MKKLISVVVFAAAFFIGANSSSAQSLSQDQQRPEAVAKMQVHELSEQLNLSGDQQRSLFRVLVAKEVSYRKHVVGQDLSNSEVASQKKKADEALMEAMKEHLTDEQYKKWLTMQK